MKYLLDTHAAIWAYERDSRLPQRVRDLMDRQPKTDFFIAYVTLVETARLLHSGKVAFADNPLRWFQEFSAFSSLGFLPPQSLGDLWLSIGSTAIRRIG